VSAAVVIMESIVITEFSGRVQVARRDDALDDAQNKPRNGTSCASPCASSPGLR